MFSKVFCYYEIKDLEEIMGVLHRQDDSFKIICDMEESKDIFSMNQLEAMLLDEFFPIYSDEIFQTYQKTKDTLIKYQQKFDKVRFYDFPIDTGLLHYVKNDVLLIEKFRKILERNKSCIFVFKKIRHANFVVQKIAKSLGYKTEDVIHLARKGRLEKITKEDFILNIQNINKISKYKNSFLLYSSNISQNEKNKLSSLLKLSKKTIPMIVRISKTKIYEKNPEDSVMTILDKIGEKTANMKLQSGFFLSSDRRDLLEIHYDIFSKFSENSIAYEIFTTDPITSSFLDVSNHPYTNFFEESYTLANVLKKTLKARILEDEIKEIARKNKFLLISDEKLNYELLDGIYRSIAISLMLKRCLTTIQAKNLVIIEGTILGMITADVAKSLGIPTFSIETLIVDNNAISSMLYKADKICIYGTQGFDTLRDYGIEENRIEVTGNPRYDYTKKLDTAQSKQKMEQNYDIKSRMVLIAMSRWHPRDEYWMSDFLHFANKNCLQVIIKIHPRYRNNSVDSQNKIKFIKTKCKDQDFQITIDIDLSLLISAADIVISDYSNVGVEGVLLKKPVINVNFTKEDLKNAQNYHKLGAVLYTESYDELEEMIKDLINDNKHINELKKNRESMVERYNSKNDGLASDRIFRLIARS